MTNSLKVAICASLFLGSVTTGFAMETAPEVATFGEQAKALFYKAGNGFKAAGNTVLEKGAQASGYARGMASNAYNNASEGASKVYAMASEKAGIVSEKAGQAYGAAAEKAGQIYASASEKATPVFKAASEKLTAAFEWAGSKTPEWVSNHPYLSGAAIVTPIVVFIGYKLFKSKPAQPEVQPVTCYFEQEDTEI